MGNDFVEFIQNIKKLCGIDLALYKEAQMKRRLISLYEKKGLSSFQQYFRYIKEEPQGLEEFLDRMTINVSEFYRNAKRWDVLDQKILPRLVSRNGVLKVWSAACSTGDEPYTLAMLLSKHLQADRYHILASDIDEAVLNQARLGRYHERSMKELPLYLKEKHFTQNGDYYAIHENLKKNILFKKQNLLSDSFDTGYDLIVCRNVMIYFTEEAKDMLYRKFSASMKPGGVLFVGSTEQIFNAAQYGFENEDTFFYKKI
ncbi:CheR family methyltransferase [Bacillus testis]|uniref:CheR family methyltransferase n=1 Tax=Bacillus testis TaxID=1622072 RepID=UPI00067E7197|nr:protein-glutamate O-methyltransferase CheR [Bacillus testis]